MEDLINEEFTDEFSILAEEEIRDGKKQICFRGILSEADKVNRNLRVYPKTVLREACLSAIEAAKQSGQPVFGELEHACFTYNDFKVLTDKGYTPFTELKVGDNVFSVNEENIAEYKPITEIIDKPYSGKVYHIFGRNIDTTVSPDHRFYLKDRNGKILIATAKEIFDDRTKFSHCSIIKNGFNWIGNDLDTVTIKGTEKQPEDLVLDAKDFFAFMGIFLSEGCSLIKHHNRMINIAQKKPENIIKIRNLLNNLHFEFSEYTHEDVDGEEIVQFYVSDSRLKEYLKPLGHSWEKYIPEELKQYNSEYLNELFEWFVIGDGRDRRNCEASKYVNVFSVSKRLIEDLQELLVKCGWSGNITEKPVLKDHLIWEGTPKERVIKAENCRTLYQLNFSKTNGIYLDKRFLNIEEEDFDGNIYCLKVKDNKNFYVEDKNKFFLTGNCDPKVHLERIAVTFPELTWNEEAGRLEGKAIPTLTEAGKTVEGLAKSGFKICFSTRCSGKVKPYSGPLLTEDVRARAGKRPVVEVCPGLKIISIDVVGSPSCQAAVTDTVYESEMLSEEISVKHKTLKSIIEESF